VTGWIEMHLLFKIVLFCRREWHYSHHFKIPANFYIKNSFVSFLLLLLKIKITFFSQSYFLSNFLSQLIGTCKMH
jgi:hypothetical protein